MLSYSQNDFITKNPSKTLMSSCKKNSNGIRSLSTSPLPSQTEIVSSNSISSTKRSCSQLPNNGKRPKLTGPTTNWSNMSSQQSQLLINLSSNSSTNFVSQPSMSSFTENSQKKLTQFNNSDFNELWNRNKSREKENETLTLIDKHMNQTRNDLLDIINIKIENISPTALGEELIKLIKELEANKDKSLAIENERLKQENLKFKMELEKFKEENDKLKMQNDKFKEDIIKFKLDNQTLTNCLTLAYTQLAKFNSLNN